MNPLTVANAFTRLMVRNSEIALASGETIFYRTMMMSGADAAPLTAAERQEFSRMYTEKIQTAMECAQVMASEWVRLNQHVAMMAWSQFMGGGMAMASLAAGRSSAGPLAAQSRFVNAAAQRVADATQRMSVTMARAMTKGLRPIHTRVSANARRLGPAS